MRTALASPLWRPVQPLPVSRSRRLLCSSSALDPPHPARPDLLAPAEALEQPHVDLLPVSDEWKGRLRSLTRPAASAMVYGLDAASPLCYRLDKDKAEVCDELQLAAFAGDVERVSQMLEREGVELPPALRKKVEKTARAFLAATEAREAAAAEGAGGATVPKALPGSTLVDLAA